jgi:pilus assembly protein Flp/PilA
VIPFLSREEGQGLIEYALIIVLVAIVAIAILLLLSDVIEEFLNQIIDFIRWLVVFVHSPWVPSFSPVYRPESLVGQG